jgi:hypothetical protein
LRSLFVLFLLFFSENTNAVDLDNELAERYALYAMMASNAYLKPDRTYFPIEELGWIKVDLDGNPTEQNSYTASKLGKAYSNLQYDIWRNESSNQTVISFKGTDEKIDWMLGNLAVGISIPYKLAKEHVKDYIENHPDELVVLTGHSLGGGMVLSISLWEGVDAYAFNPSPRLFDGIKNHIKPAIRMAVFQEGDILQKLSKYNSKFTKVIASKDIIQTHFDFAGESPHRADLLAEGILRCAVSLSSKGKFTRLLEMIPSKVECNL